MAITTRYGVEMVKGSKEFIYGDIRADRVLDAQPVEFSVSATEDPSTWISAAWEGTAGKFRSARILLDTAPMAEGSYWVFARITDNPEVPIILLGRLHIT